jgi:hypothetical protein
LPVLRYPQFELSYARYQRPAVIARTVSKPACCALALLGAERLVHLALQHLLHNLLDERSQKILLLSQSRPLMTSLSVPTRPAYAFFEFQPVALKPAMLFHPE